MNNVNTYKVNEEAVKKIAERVYDNGSTVINRNDLEEMFPELQSKDEQMRKKCIELIKELKTFCMRDGQEECIAWLEKQGKQQPIEQKPTEWTAEDEEELKIALNTLEEAGQYSSAKWLKNVCLVPQTMQKPTEWSEEDDSKLKEVLYYIEYVNKTNVTFQQRDLVHLINWLKSLKGRYTWKPSSEQMRVLDLAIRCGINRGTTEETTLVSLFNDLKKLKG